ncbi:MogA/MoaB family molybdenum cofactor biosynthesis protein [Propionibacteriaceae bacterium Y1685]|uniref:MogA/MoaB family molybdenum cofactor biosynthesis protein n=1 Tax=Microlunatus sp. Y1700 TaxID=3418487 RepID=UPI003B8044D6
MNSAEAGTHRAVVLTVSTRAAAGEYEDRSGPIIVEALRELGLSVGDPVIIADGEPVREALTAAVGGGAEVVITTGGTGISPSDRTPEITADLLDVTLPHLANAIAAYGVAHGVPTAVLSRGVAGVAGRTLVINLPGSTGGVRDGMAVLGSILPHALAQLAGGDH